MKKIISLLMAFVILFSLMTFTVSAASATFSVSAPGSVIIGNKINVTVKLSGSEKIGSWRFSLNYDPSVLEYVSGADGGGGGAVLFADSSDGVSSYSRTVVFRAKKIGSTSVSVSGAQVVSFETVSNMQVAGASCNVNVKAAPVLSAENNLSALTLSAGELTPAFDSAVTSYAMTVPFEISNLVISATPKDGSATVSVSGADILLVGENVVSVVVTAQNGTKKTYTITVTRQESEFAGSTAQLGEKVYTIAHDTSAIAIPEGYLPSSAVYGDKKILTFSSPKDTLKVAYLFDDISGAWYIYNENDQSFTPFVTLSNLSGLLVIVTPSEETKIPDGFVPQTITVEEKTIDAYTAPNSKDANIYLIYGMASDGSAGFYYYDATLGSFTTYFVPDSAISEEAQSEIDSLNQKLNKSEKALDEMIIIALSVGIFAVILFFAFVISLVTRKKKAQPDFEDTYMVSLSADSENQTEEEEAAESYEEEVFEPEQEEIHPVKKRKARRTIEKKEEVSSPEEIQSIFDESISLTEETEETVSIEEEEE